MEWKEVRLGDVCEIKHGFAYKGKYFSDTPTCDILVTPGNFTLSGGFKLDKPKFYNGPVEKDYILSKGDLIVTMTDLSKNIDTLGYSALVPEVKGFTFHHNQRIGLVENIANNVDKYFLYWIMRTPAYQSFIATHSSGTTVHHTSPKGIGNYVFKLPPLDDQRRIASILSSLDRKIELNNKINADLEEMAQAIFKNWFVDFEPFKDGKFVDSELGMIPEGWKVISLNEILDNVSGYSYKGSELQSSNIAMATIKNFERKGGFKTEGYKEIVISKKIKETQFVNMFDVLVAHTDLTQNAEIVGNPAIVLSKGGYEKLIMSMDLTKVISKIDGVTNGLLYCILSTSRFKEHALGYVNGTTVLHMSKKAVPEYTCAFPKDINQIRDLCITLDSIYKRMAVTYDENSRLSLLRDTLLPRLMSGELEVPE